MNKAMFANLYMLLSGDAQDTEDLLHIPFFEAIKNYFVTGRFIRSAVVIAVGVAIWLIIKLISRKQLKKLKQGTSLERNSHFIMTGVKVVLTFCVLIIVLQVNGVNVTSLVAGLGIVSVIVGFAFQDLLADWINGITIAAEHFFNVGDVIQVDEDLIGRVVKINLKVTQLEEIKTGSIVTLNNRLLSKATILSCNLNLYAPIPYTMTPGEISKFLSEISDKISKVDGVVRCENKGLNSFDDSKMTYLLRIVIDDAFKRLQKTREANDIILETYDEWGMSVPYNQLDVHIKEK